MAEIDGSIVKRTQETLGKYVKRPPLTEKLLLRPPFRFLHDIVTMVIKETGFLDGLYTEDELNSDNVKDRDAKIQFLDKLISAINNVTNQNLSVRSAKIVAGLEADKTNELLQAIGDALDRKLDSKKAVETVVGGKTQKPKATEKPVVKKESNNKKDSTATKPTKVQNGTAGKEDKPKPKMAVTTNGRATVKKTPENQIAKTKEKEKTIKDKSNKPGPVKQPMANKIAASKTTPAVKKEVKPMKPKDKEKEPVLKPNIVEEPAPQEVIKNGHDVQPPPEPLKIASIENLALGETVVEEKPTVSKPPTPVHQPAAPVAADLEKEFEPKIETSKLESLKRSDTKDELSAIIDAEAEMRKKERKAKRSSSKLRQPPDTDILKDDDKIETTSESKHSATPPISQKEEEKPRPTAAHQSPKERKVEQPSPPRENTRTVRQSSMEASPKERPSYVRQPTEIDKTAVRPRTSLRPPSVRPASARPAAPTRRRDKNIEIVLQPEEQVKLGAINVKMESFNTDLEDDGENLVVIEDATMAQDNLTQDSGIFSGSGLDTNGEATSAQQQGHLVQQILETQTKFSTPNDTRKTEMEWDTSGQKLTYTKQMESIRDSLQKITRSVNPLGKLMDFLQEDIDSMQRELELWQDRYNQANLELQREKELTLSAMDPLRHQLAQIGDNIKEHKEIIDASRASILQNDQKIYKLLTEM